ncbi:hypothetical protein C8J57DRAFT_1062864, partial [Mycena rebaudengoi]
NNASLTDYDKADKFCRENPRIFPAMTYPAHPLSEWCLSIPPISTDSASTPPGLKLRRIRVDKMKRSKFRVQPTVTTLTKCDDNGTTAHFDNRGDACFVSNLPIMAGMYDTSGKRGAYYEVTIRKMDRVILHTGMQCLPYPAHRLPGWHRKSVALHLDRRIFFNDSEGGSDYTHPIRDEYGNITEQACVPAIGPKETVTLGCGYEFNSVGNLFYTYNGRLLPAAIHRTFDAQLGDADLADLDGEAPRMDVFAAVGVTNGDCDFDINFGLQTFAWAGPNPSGGGPWSAAQWTVDGIFNRLASEAPPQYYQA